MPPSARRGRELGLPLLFHHSRWRRDARDTFGEASAVSTGIAASTITVVAIVLATDPGSTAPRREGLAATALFPPSFITARYKVGLQTSCTGVGAMLNPVSVRLLPKSIG